MSTNPVNGGSGTYEINVPSDFPFIFTNPKGNLTTSPTVIEVKPNYSFYQLIDNEKEIEIEVKFKQ